MTHDDNTELHALDTVTELFHEVAQCQALGMQVVSVERGNALVRMPYDPRHVGDPNTGIVHGGVITTLLVSAGGCAAISVSPVDQIIATLDLRIDYLKPATPGEDIRGFAECYRRTRDIAFVRGLAYHEDRNDPIANFTACFMTRDGGLAPEADLESS